MTPGAEGGMIFVMSKSGKIYGADMIAEVLKRSDKGNKEYVGFHHSSFLAGGEVAGAGEIQVSGGQLTSISDASGHYKPKVEFLYQFLNELARKGVALGSNVTVKATGKKATTADQFLAGNQLKPSNRIQDPYYASETPNNNGGQRKFQGSKRAGKYASHLPDENAGQTKPSVANQAGKYISQLTNNKAGQMNLPVANQAGEYASDFGQMRPQGSNKPHEYDILPQLSNNAGQVNPERSNVEEEAPYVSSLVTPTPDQANPEGENLEEEPPYVSSLATPTPDQASPEAGSSYGSSLGSSYESSLGSYSGNLGAQPENADVQPENEASPISLSSEIEEPEPQEAEGEESFSQHSGYDTVLSDGTIGKEQEQVEEDEEEEEVEELQ